MPPIRKGDGTPVTPKGISQIRTGDGRILFDGVAIPDSAVLNFDAANFDTPTWPNGVDNEPDMSVSGLSTTTLSNGTSGVGGDGNDDFGEVTLPSALDGNALQSQTIEFSIELSNDDIGHIVSNINSNGNQATQVRINDPDPGHIRVFCEDDDDNRLRFGTDQNPNINDGEVHNVTVDIADSSQNDVNIHIDGSSVGLTFSDTDGPSNFTTWDYDCAFWAQRLTGGGTTAHLEAASGIIRWHDESTGQTI